MPQDKTLAVNNETNQRFNGAQHQKIYVYDGTGCCTGNGNMWYTVVSRCAVPHVSPLGPLRRSPRETLLVTISEWSRALFNTLIRFTIRDSVCTSVFVHNYCPRHVFRAIFIGTLSARRSLSPNIFSRAQNKQQRVFPLVLACFLNFSITLPALLTVLSAPVFFRATVRLSPGGVFRRYIDIQLFADVEHFRGLLKMKKKQRGQTLDGAWWRRERRPVVLMAPPVLRAKAETEPNSGGAFGVCVQR